MYPNVFAASRAIMDAAGVRGLFTGYLPTLLEDVPDMAFKFAAYESLRSLHRRANGGRNANAQVRAMLLSLDIFCLWLRFLEGILLEFSARWSQPQTFLKGSIYNLCCRVEPPSSPSYKAVPRPVLSAGVVLRLGCLWMACLMERSEMLVQSTYAEHT